MNNFFEVLEKDTKIITRFLLFFFFKKSLLLCKF